MAIRGDNYWASSPDTIVAVTPSDSVNFLKPAKSLYVLTTGNLAVVTTKGSVSTLPVTAGQLISLQVKRVNSTNTTATCVAFI